MAELLTQSGYQNQGTLVPHSLTMDVTINIQGTDVERKYGRPILNAFHAWFSVGSLVSALLGSALAAINVSIAWHFLSHRALCWVGIAWSWQFLFAFRTRTI